MLLIKKIRGGINFHKSYQNCPNRMEKFPLSGILNFPIEGCELLVSDQEVVNVGSPLFVDTHGLRVHASAGGVVSLTQKQLTITTDKKNSQNTFLPYGLKTKKTVQELTPDDLIAEVKAAGIPDVKNLPLWKKLERATGKVSQIAVCCLETQPHQQGAHLLMTSFAKEVVGGLKILMAGMGVNKGILALPSQDRIAYQAAAQAIGSEKKWITCQQIYPDYPVETDRLLFYALTKREISISKLPEEAGILIVSARAAYQIYHLFLEGHPCTDAIVSIEGYGVEHPGNYILPIGTPIAHLLRGLFLSEPVIVVENGLLSGKELHPEDIITPFTVSLTIIPAQEENNLSPTLQACIGCNRCYDVCPMYLSPIRLVKNSSSAWENCIFCGLCAYSCPAEIPLLKLLSKKRQPKESDKEEETI
jgi:electron transport complex protein RnfC